MLHDARRQAYDDPTQPDDALMDMYAVPQYGRVQIPLRDPFWYRMAADELRNLANRLDLLGRRQDESAHMLALMAHSEISSCNLKLKHATKSRGQR